MYSRIPNGAKGEVEVWTVGEVITELERRKQEDLIIDKQKKKGIKKVGKLYKIR